MNILLVGLNHNTAHVDVREKLAFTEGKAGECIQRVREMGLAHEALVLSTCNRVEFYHVWDRSDHFDHLAKFLGQFHKVSFSDYEKSLYFYQNEDTVRHLFRVVSGLDSMVIGEKEILGQVKRAYALAADLKSTGPILNSLFQKAFYVAKNLQVSTGIHEGSLSVSSVAVQLTEKIFGDLSSKSVLLIGAGEMSEQTVERLVEKGIRGIVASNRSFDKAENLAHRFGGRAVHLDDISSVIPQVDIIISSTASPHFILKKDDIIRFMGERKQRPLFIVDIAVPRDVDPEVHSLDNVYLYNIDDLKSIADRNLEKRLKEKQRAEDLVDLEVKRFMQWYEGRGVRPILEKLQKKMEQMRIEELQKTKNYLPHADTSQWEQIDYLTQRLMKRFLEGPLTHVNRNPDDKYAMGLSQVLSDLFQLEDVKE